MKKLLTCLLLGLSSIVSMSAQSKFNVTGTIIEKATNDVVMAATVRILSLPDSSMVGGAATDTKGQFTVRNVKKGKYAVKVTFIGYKDHVIPLDLTNKKTKEVNIGYITLADDSKMLEEAVVSAAAAQVQVSGDSLVYNTSAFRTPEGSALEELVKKLPGAEIDDDGNITINGKKVSKILVDGKEFFLNDKNIALKNIPTKIIDRIKTYDRKSDLARVTGIDDGEEETVLDLQIKKGMNKGWFGNLDAAIGTEHRYSEKMMLNRFMEGKQFTLLGSMNNIGDRGFGGGGGRGGWGRGGNGLSANKQVGFNWATTSTKLETGGNVRYRYDGSDSWNRTNSQNFVNPTGAFNNRIQQSFSSNYGLNADFRFEWKPDTMTNIIFRPSGSISRNRGMNNSQNATYNTGSEMNVQDRLNWAEAHVLDADSIFNDIVNTNISRSQSYSLNKNLNGELQINRKLNDTGRNITFRATGGLSSGESKQLSASNISYRKTNTTNSNNRYYTTPSSSERFSLQGTYSEPIATKTYLQFSYRFDYSHSKNDRAANVWADDIKLYNMLNEALSTNRYNVTGALDQMITNGGIPNNDFKTDSMANRLSQSSHYKNFNHTIGISFRKVTDMFNLSAGVQLLPQQSTLDYKYMGTDYPKISRTVFNWSPNLDFRYNFNKQTQLRANYWGRTQQPSMTNLLDITDDSNPLNITKGNPNLDPSFTHTIRLNYNTYNADLQQGIFTFGNLSFTQNSISNRTWYDENTGVRTTRPENINGNWNGNIGFGYNRGLGAKKYFTVNTFTNLNYNHHVSYLDPSRYKDDISKTNQLGVNERLSGAFRKDWFEFSINGNLNYTHSRNNVLTTSKLDTWNFGYGCELNLNFDMGISFNSDISMASRRGYASAEMNTNELLWNAQLSYSFLKGRALTVTAQWNDILKQRSNISRTISAMSSSDSEYNAIYSYGMIHLIYKLNIFGGKSAGGRGEGAGPGGFRGGFGGQGGQRGPGGQGGGRGPR